MDQSEPTVSLPAFDARRSVADAPRMPAAADGKASGVPVSSTERTPLNSAPGIDADTQPSTDVRDAAISDAVEAAVARLAAELCDAAKRRYLGWREPYLMARRFKYNPLTDPHPTRWFRGFVSRAQARHFVADDRLHKYVGGMRFWVPPVGRRKPLPEKMADLPARLHPKRRARRTR